MDTVVPSGLPPLPEERLQFIHGPSSLLWMLTLGTEGLWCLHLLQDLAGVGVEKEGRKADNTPAQVEE